MTRGARPVFRLAAAVLATSVLALAGGCQGLRPGPTDQTLAQMGRHMLRVNCTRQAFYPRRPWQPGPTQNVSAVGVVLAGGRVLVSAGVVADHRHIEVEKIDTGAKCTAAVVAVDYEADLALLTGDDPGFMADMQPMALTTAALPGDRLDVLQVQPSGRIIASPASVETVELAPYPYGNQFLVYRLSGSLQNRHGNLTLPVIQEGRLAGMLKRDDSPGQTLDVIPAPLIAHFLADIQDGGYDGFPLSGIRFVSTEDPQLRRWAGLADDGSGVLVENVYPGSAAEQAGFRVGDVLTAIDDHAVDSRGYYVHPRLGRIGIAHLIRCGYQVGERARVSLRRQGRKVEATLVLAHPAAETYLVPPYRHDRPPRYYVLGGLVLQELSAAYLMDFGKNWAVEAPIHLLYSYRHQFDVKRPAGDKIVVLNAVLPTSATIGYEQINNAVVTRINGIALGRLDDVPRALQSPVGGFHRIEIDQPPFRVYLDPMQLAAIDGQVRERYDLPRPFNLKP